MYRWIHGLSDKKVRHQCTYDSRMIKDVGAEVFGLITKYSTFLEVYASINALDSALRGDT